MTTRTHNRGAGVSAPSRTTAPRIDTTNDPQIDSLMTRDIPLPSRDLRLGLAGSSGKTTSSTRGPLVVDDAIRVTSELTITTLKAPAPKAEAPKAAAPKAEALKAPAPKAQPTKIAPAPKAAPVSKAKKAAEVTATAAVVTSTKSAPVADAAAPPIKTPPAGKAKAKHRGTPPPNALRSRTALIAVAAGAAAAGVAGLGTDATPAATSIQPTAAAATAAGDADGTQGGVVPASSTSDMSSFTDQLAVGKQIADAKAAAEAAARRPLYASPIDHFVLTSGFETRWGTFHGGLDLSAPLGTPIHAVTDGVVKEAGPASGYGNWIQILADDGTITMYGHMASSGVLVTPGQRVTAGDVIALVGSEGFSTGPHCHFEVWKDGTSKVDPAPWLAERGIRT